MTKLTKLSLLNFAGIKQLGIEPNGDSVTISGQNGTGKSTILNAITWCLTGKNTAGETDLQDVKPNDLHNQDVVVTILLDVTRFTRTLREKRNDRDEVTGHETYYEIGGVGVKKTEFDATVAQLTGGADLHDLILTGSFQSKDWKERRSVLFKMAGEVSDVDIASQEGYTEIATQLKSHPLDRLREQARASVRKLKDAQKILPHRIDEKKRELPDLSGVTEAKKKVAQLDKQIADLQSKSTEALKSDESDRLHEQLRDAKTQIIALKSGREKLAIKEDEQRRRKIGDKINSLNKEISSLEHTMQPYLSMTDTGQLERTIKELREQYKQVKSWSTEPSEDQLSCPACERPFEDASVEQIRKELNAKKSAELERISKEGAEAKKKLDKAHKINAEDKLAVDDLQQQIAELEKERNELREKRDNAQVDIAPPGKREIELAEKVKSLQADLEKMSTNQAAPPETAVIERLQSERDQLRDTVALEKQADTVNTRVRELEQELADTNDALADKQRTLDNLDAIIEAKVNAIEGRLHEIFSPVSFRMFRRQLNGELKEICETELNGRVWSQLSTGEQVKTGMYICKSLQAHFGVSLPLLIDNAESITTGGDIAAPQVGQAIYCKAVEGQEKLSIEVAKQATTGANSNSQSK